MWVFVIKICNFDNRMTLNERFFNIRMNDFIYISYWDPSWLQPQGSWSYLGWIWQPADWDHKPCDYSQLGSQSVWLQPAGCDHDIWDPSWLQSQTLWSQLTVVTRLVIPVSWLSNPTQMGSQTLWLQSAGITNPVTAASCSHSQLDEQWLKCCITGLH